MDGWIKIHRSILDWEWYDDINTCRLFLHLLFKANYENKKWHGVDILRGQLITSRANLSHETRLSEREVRTALEHLQTTNEISVQTTNTYTLVTICNYDIYQLVENENDQVDVISNDQQIDQVPTKYRPSTDQVPTTTKEIKKERNKEENIKETIINDSKEKTPASLTLAPPQEGATPKKTIKDMQKDMEQRLQTFMDSIRPFVEIYGRDMCNEFYAYWSEPNKSKTKFRAENEATWDIARRLERWSRNNFKTISNGQQSTNSTRQTTGVAAAQEQLARIHQRYTAQ